MQIWRRWTQGGHRSILIFFYYNIVVFCSWLSELTAFVANCENKRDFYLFCLRPFRLLPEHHKSWAAIYCKKNKHRCLFSAPCSAVHYLDRSACSVGRQAFLIVQSLLMKTHWRIYLLLLALSSEREGETVPVHLPPSSLTFKRTHTLFPALPRCPCWKDLNTPYRHRSTPANQIMLCHDVPFPFYVNTSYQPRMCQHKLLAPLLKFRLPHYPDLSRIKLRRLEWASPHSWYESAQSAQNKTNPLCTAWR